MGRPIFSNQFRLSQQTRMSDGPVFGEQITDRLVLQRRLLNLVSYCPEIASRKARPQSCQAHGQVAMKRPQGPFFRTVVVILEVWPKSHCPGFALRQADVFQSYAV